MSEKTNIHRRSMLKMLTGTGLMLGGLLFHKQDAFANKKSKKKKHGYGGTPRQFYPKNGPDTTPLQNELEKYPHCPYCGMSRKKFNHSRHLIHYSDDRIDPTCSIHCTAIGLSLNIDRGIKAIYTADFGAQAKIKPLVEVEKVTYLVGSTLKGTMSMQSKMAFANATQAAAAKSKHGGETGDFDFALTKAYLSMAKDTHMIRKKRAERKKKKQANRHHE